MHNPLTRTYVMLLTILLMGTVGVSTPAEMPPPVAVLTAEVPPPAPLTSESLRSAVTGAGVYEHLVDLEQIALENNGNRAAGSPGYDASVEYVVHWLEVAGYAPVVQEFSILYDADVTPPRLERTTAPAATFAAGSDIRSMEDAGRGDATGPLVAVDLTIPAPRRVNDSSSGCEDEDWQEFPEGAIALLQRGGCSFGEKAARALEASAAGAIVMNEGQRGRTGIFGGKLDTPMPLPVLSASFDVGEALRNGVTHGPTGIEVQMHVDRVRERRPTYNVIAEMPAGSAGDSAGEASEPVIMLGAHLDGVLEGPGMNDNASGAALLLELAEAYAFHDHTDAAPVRFVWWGAEELGLLGSRYYVNQLSPDEVEQIALYLNFDMVGSVNYVRQIYGGNMLPSAPPPDSDVERTVDTEALIETFRDYFDDAELAVDHTALGGGSDHMPFASVGIPVAGLHTGAGQPKSAAEAALFGGDENAPLDPCYHEACDTLDNIDVDVLDQMIDAAAHALATLALRNELP